MRVSWRACSPPNLLLAYVLFFGEREIARREIGVGLAALNHPGAAGSHQQQRGARGEIVIAGHAQRVGAGCGNRQDLTKRGARQPNVTISYRATPARATIERPGSTTSRSGGNPRAVQPTHIA